MPKSTPAAILCPPWCTEDHTDQETVIEGDWKLGVQHERLFTEIAAKDPAWVDAPATATVYVECSTENDRVTDLARVVVTLAAGAHGAYPGSENTQGWSGTTEQGRELAAAIIAACDLRDRGAALAALPAVTR